MNVHVGKKPHKCPHCEKRFYNKGHLKSHIRNHTGEKPYVCDHCGKGFAQPNSLKGHLYTHTGEKPYTCAHCNKGFTCPSKLKVHLLPKTRRNFLCHICHTIWKCPGVLRKHMDSHRMENHECTDCGKTFKDSHILKRHMATHKCDTQKTKRKCSTGQIPPKTIKSTNILKTQNNAFQEEEKVCTCPSIYAGMKPDRDFKYDSKENIPHGKVCLCGSPINSKMFKIDRSRTDFSRCQTCVVGFLTTDALKDHLQTHSGGERHVCTSCRMTFSQASELSSHMFRIHGLETPNSKCFFCVRGFMKSHDLKLHLMSHK